MKTDDLISRAEAIELVTDMNLINNTAKGILRERLRKLTPTPPERKKYTALNIAINKVRALLETEEWSPCIECSERDCTGCELEPGMEVKG